MSAAPGKFQFRRKTAAPAATVMPPTQNIFKNVGSTGRLNLKFTLAPTDVAYANTLRRAILTEVESVAFRADIMEDGSTSDVKILKNSTPMSNEMLAHRIGLLPIYVANPLEWIPSKYSFKLSVVNDSPDPRDITASDIQVLMNRGAEEEPLPIPSNELFHLDPVSQDTPLLAVLKGRTTNQEPESLIFEAKATIGIGRENARFIPTAQCSYRYTPDEDPVRRKEFFENWLQFHKKLSPADLESNPTRKGELEREFSTMEINRCYMINDKNEPMSFDFLVESVGPLDPVYIVARALQVIQEKLQVYASIEAGDLPENVQVRPADARMKGFDFIFAEEDHTLGNLLQTWMDANLMDTGDITYVGYKVPHPLKDEMVVRVGVEDGKEITAREALVKAVRALSAMFKGWSDQWAAIGGTAAAMPTIRTALQTRRRGGAAAATAF